MNSDLYFEGKKYISSSRAAKISGYVNDYIGQLCRDGKLESKMIGRSWYVSLDSLISHKNTYGLATRSKGFKKGANVTLLPPLPAPPSFTEARTPVAVTTAPTPVIETPVATPSPEIASALATPAFVEVPTIARDVISPWQEEKQKAGLGYGKASVSKLGFGKLNVLKVAGVLATIAVLVTGFRIGMFVNPDAATWYSAEASRAETSLQANVFSAVGAFWNNTALAFYDNVSGLFHHSSSVLVSNEPSGVSADQTSGDVTGSAEPSSGAQGMVVVPTDAGTDRAGVVAKIKNSFSDDVVVKPGDSESGVITPVFKNSKSSDYLYVLVPVSGSH